MKFNKKANLFILIFFTIYITILLVLFFRFESVKTGDNNYFVHDNIELIDALNKEVTSIVKMLELYDKNIRSKIFLTANFVEYALFAPANWRSFGATYPFPNLIIIAPSSVDKNMVFRNGKENNIRKLSSVIAHEIIHVLINNKYGIIRSRFLPKWKVEGYADYIANESSFDEKLGLEYFCAKKENDSPSYKYFKYRKYISYLMNEGYNFDKIINSEFDLKDLEKETRLALCLNS